MLAWFQFKIIQNWDEIERKINPIHWKIRYWNENDVVFSATINIVELESLSCGYVDVIKVWVISVHGYKLSTLHEKRNAHTIIKIALEAIDSKSESSKQIYSSYTLKEHDF
jgi:hypothetical protein